MATTAVDIVGGATHATLAVLFAGAAYVQLNDPDPYLWAFTYLAGGTAVALYAALVCAKKLRPIPLEFAFLVVVVTSYIPGSMLVRSLSHDWRSLLSVLYSVAVEQSQSPKALVELEVVRECGGMALLLIYLFEIVYPTILEGVYETPSERAACRRAGESVQWASPTSRRSAATQATSRPRKMFTTVLEADEESDTDSQPSSQSAHDSPRHIDGSPDRFDSPLKPEHGEIGRRYSAGRGAPDSDPTPFSLAAIRAQVTHMKPTQLALAFLAVYASLWVAWRAALQGGHVSVDAHCQGLL